MTLKDWIRRERITVAELALALGETESIVSKWVYRLRQPSLPNAALIHDLTNGEVGAKDLLMPGAEKQAPLAAPNPAPNAPAVATG